MLKLFFTQIIFCHPQTSKNLEENSLKKIYKENLHWISEQEFFNPIPVEGSLYAVWVTGYRKGSRIQQVQIQ